MKEFNTEFLHAYFICGSQDVPKGKTLPGIVAEALAAGITAFQFRDKGPNSTLSKTERLPMAQKLHQLCYAYHVPFFIDDDVQLAQQVAQELGHQQIENEHIFKAIAQVDENVLPFILKKLNVNTNLLYQILEKELESFPKVSGGEIIQTEKIILR